ncbi:MAG TPA: AsmA family protein [Candidatus Aquilonibacter sp.]|nr:AsmA family protein [Candidatus Aquilonibacter sp.]
MKKILWGGIVGLVVLIVIAVVVVALFLDSIVKTGVEAVGPKITGVSVKLDAVHISLLTGSASVKDLVIGNPEGYKTPNAISVGTANIGVDPLSIFSDKIVLPSVKVVAPEITFEGGLGGNNLGKILDNVETVSQNGGPTTTNTAANTKPAKKYEVDDLLITGAKVHISLTGLGGKEMTLPLPDIELKNLGKGSDGLTATDLTRAVLSAITSATVKVVAGTATNVGKGAEKLGNKGVNRIKNGIDGLFGK